MQDERQIAAGQIAVGIADRLPGPLIPKHDGAAAILALRNGPFEGPIIQRMILDMHRKTLVLGIEAGAARHRPTLENAAQLQTKIVMKPGRRVLLDQIGMTRYFAGLLAGGLARFGKVALRAVVREFGVRRGTSGGHLENDQLR
jgi:hypothetical protein